MEARHGRGRALPRDQESRNKQDLQDKGIGRATKAKSPRSPTDENTDSRERCRMMMMMMMMIMLVNMSWVQGVSKKLLMKLWWSPKIPRSKLSFVGPHFLMDKTWKRLIPLSLSKKQPKTISRDGLFQVWERLPKQGVSVSCDSAGAPWLQHVTICCDTPKEPFWWEDSGKFLGPSFGCFFYYLMIWPFHLK